jgi:hypothetical protein
MENLSKQTIASLFAAFLIFAVGFAATIDQIGKPNAPNMHCDSHLHCIQDNG